MALKKNRKVSTSNVLVGQRIYSEAIDNPSVDDVIAFMAHSEAQRKYILPLTGDKKETQEPSDLLKEYLMRLEDG